MKNARGFVIMEGVIAVGIFGVLIVGLAHLANQSYSQQAFLSDRQAAMGIHLDVLEILSKREACENSFANRIAEPPQSPPPSQILGPSAVVSPLNTKYTVGQEYGPEGARFRLTAMRLDGLRERRPATGAGRGRMTLTMDFTRARTGFGMQVMPARIDLIVTLNAGNQIQTCMAVGRDLNQPWSRVPLTSDIVNFGNNVGIGINPPAQKLSLLAPDDTVTVAYAKSDGFYEPSDARLKEILQTRNGLKDLEEIHGVLFRWRGGGRPDMGVIAQEVQKAIPEAVSESNGFLTVNPAQLIPSLIEATKQLAARQRELQELSRAQERELRELRLKLEH